MSKISPLLSQLKQINESAATAGMATIKFKAVGDAVTPMVQKVIDHYGANNEFTNEGDTYTYVGDNPDAVKKELDTIGVEYINESEDTPDLRDAIKPQFDALANMMEDDSDDEEVLNAIQALLDGANECMTSRKK